MHSKIHRSKERGRAEHDWLSTRFSFSFANYQNPQRMNFGLLRVLNDDTIAGGGGFGFHPHDNMEIVTIVTEGELFHRDSMGNEGKIPAGDVQRMSAGTGVVHSEMNASKTRPVKLFQIWVFPKEKNIEPSYEQKGFARADKKNKLLCIVSGNKEGALGIHQDAEFFLGEIGKQKSVFHKILDERGVFVFVVKGKVQVGKEVLNERDSIEISGAEKIELKAIEESEVLVIEVPMK